MKNRVFAQLICLFALLLTSQLFAQSATVNKNEQKSILSLLPVGDADKMKKASIGSEEKAVESLEKLLGKDYGEVKMDGNERTRLHGPIVVEGKEIYVWTITGKFTSTQNETKITSTGTATGPRKTYTGTARVTRTREYIYMCYFSETGKTVDIYLSAGPEEKHKNKKVFSAIYELCYKIAIERQQWDFNGRTINGKFIGYRNKIVDIMEDAGDQKSKKLSLTVNRFSQADQDAIFLILSYHKTSVEGTLRLPSSP